MCCQMYVCRISNGSHWRDILDDNYLTTSKGQLHKYEWWRQYLYLCVYLLVFTGRHCGMSRVGFRPHTTLPRPSAEQDKTLTCSETHRTRPILSVSFQSKSTLFSINNVPPTPSVGARNISSTISGRILTSTIKKRKKPNPLYDWKDVNILDLFIAMHIAECRIGRNKEIPK